MRFRSVRGGAGSVGFREALFAGIAPDGGLFVPETMPRLEETFLSRLSDASLHDCGLAVLSPFIDDVPPADLARIVDEAWDFPLPLTPLPGGIHLLELFHGPTLAFKDVGARFMARMLSYYVGQASREVTILVATSGDTGSAVAHGFHGVPHVRVFVLYPSGRISKLQEMQIATLGGNIHALEIEGTFDDCQALVKRTLSDPDVRAKRDLTTANSINVGRLLPQIVYYVWAVGRWGVPPWVVVPSGNFGNITAAAHARAMGVPMAGLVAATNANDVVPEYFRTGVLRTRPSQTTFSNAMDVGDPSNLARLVSLYDDDLDRLRQAVQADSVTDEETLEEIRDTWNETGRVLDPHTAVGVRVARRLLPTLPGGSGIIVPATAHPGKFPEVIARALGEEPPLPPALVEALGRAKQSVRLPVDYVRVKGEILAG